MTKRILEKNIGATATESYAYDAHGNRVLVSNLASCVRSVYNVYGTATNETVMIGTGTTQFTTGLDAFNRVVSLTTRGETVQRIRRR